MTDPATIYLLANGGVLILILGQLFRMERRLGYGDNTLDRIQKHCPLFNGNDKFCQGGENVSHESHRQKNTQ